MRFLLTIDPEQAHAPTAAYALVLGLVAGAAHLAACERPAPPPPLTASLYALAEEAGRELGLPPIEGERPRRALRAIVERARAVRDRRAGPGEPDPIARILLDVERAGIAPDPVDASIERALLPQVLANRRGSCLGLSAVYLAVAEQLGVPAQGVIAPGHFFVRRVLGGAPWDVELLEGGRALSLAELRRRHQVPASNPLYLRPLSREETLAAVRFNLANALRERRRPRDAVRHYLRVLQTLPELAEAHQNLGLSYFRLGEHARAERAYLRALALSPDLRGLRGNLDALRRVWPARDARPPP